MRIADLRLPIGWLCPLLCSSICFGHGSLLPAPQELQEGSGTFAIRGAQICFSNKTVSEDLFAATELASILGAATHSDFPVNTATCKGKAVVLNRTGEVDALPVPGEQPGKQSREAYSIVISPSRVAIEARSSAGLFYAVQTLKQMLETAPEATLPEATVHDWPALVYRGLMMDMSHAQLPKLEELKKQIDFLASWKVNQYLFYSEASIALDGYPVLGPEASFSKAEVKEIIDYARQRHMDVIPNVELYGHLHDLFRMERYANLSAIPHGGEFSREAAGVDPLLTDWISQLSALFPSKFFHIGFDETWLLEREAERLHRKPEDLYLEQLQTVVAKLEKHGKIPMAWADMMEKYPQMIPRLPKNLVAFPWHYEPLSPSEYDRFFAPFRQAKLPIIVQSAVVSWRWLIPDFHTSFENDDLLLAAGRKYGAIGFMNSEWTDDTQVLTRMARPAMAHGSVAAWSGSAPPADQFFTQYTSTLYTPETARSVARALQKLQQAETFLQEAQGSGTIDAFWDNPFSPIRLHRSEAHREDLHQCRLAAEEAETLLRGSPQQEDPVTIQAFLVGSRMLNYAALKYIYADEIAGFWRQLGEHPKKYDVTTLVALETAAQYHSRSADMLDAISDLRDHFRIAWLEEYTPFRLSVALGKYDSEFQFWWHFQRRVQKLASGFHDADQLPPLETVVGFGQ